MRRMPIWTAGVLTLMLGAGCGDSEPARNNETAPATPGSAPTARAEQPDGDDVTVTGCLTGGPNGTYVLTANSGPEVAAAQRGVSGTRETYTYQLVGGQNLQEHMGRRVEVAGRLNEDVDEEIEMEAKRETPTTGAGGATPAGTVETKEEIDVEIRQLHIASVRQVSGTCEAGR